mgnify:FL=1
MPKAKEPAVKLGFDRVAGQYFVMEGDKKTFISDDELFRNPVYKEAVEAGLPD